MAITGTGTQQDPYIITNLPDFITAVCTTSDVETYRGYIKIANDIDCALEPTYTGKITTPIELTNRFVYADSPVTITGLTIEGIAFMYAYYSSGGSVTNVNFINCCYKRTENTFPVFYSRGNTTPINFTNCKISLVCSLGTMNKPLFAGYCISQNCSFYLKVVNSQYGYLWNTESRTNPYNPAIKFTKCNVVIDGMKVLGLGDGNYAMNCLIAYGDSSRMYSTIWADTSAIIYKNCDIHSNTTIPGTSGTTWLGIYTKGVIPSFFDASYLAVVGCTITDSNNNTITTLQPCNFALTGITSIIATDDSNVTLSDPTPSNIKADTVANIKSKQHLIDIGFLP